METSKEELQSTNEELVTVNTELQNKVDELSNTNSDINNLLASTDIGTIFLDMQLRIRRYTPAMTRIFNLIPTDVDRPISDITGKVKFVGITSDAEEVLRTLVQTEKEVMAEDGTWYSMKIAPYRTLENVIDGVVITFVDITKIRVTRDTRRLATVVRDSNDAITVQDFEGNISAWNRGAERMYGYSETEALKMNIRDIVPDNKKKEALNLVKKVQKEEVKSINSQRKTKDGQILNVWLTFTKLVDDDGKPVAVATTERDLAWLAD